MAFLASVSMLECMSQEVLIVNMSNFTGHYLCCAEEVIGICQCKEQLHTVSNFNIELVQ